MIAYTAYTDLHLNQINLHPPPHKKKIKNKKQKTYDPSEYRSLVLYGRTLMYVIKFNIFTSAKFEIQYFNMFASQE